MCYIVKVFDMSASTPAPSPSQDPASDRTEKASPAIKEPAASRTRSMSPRKLAVGDETEKEKIKDLEERLNFLEDTLLFLLRSRHMFHSRDSLRPIMHPDTHAGKSVGLDPDPAIPQQAG